MTHLLRFVLVLLAMCSIVGISSSCSEDADCSMEGRRMIYCGLYTIDPDNKETVLKDTLDSLTITALGTDSIILNNQKKVTKLSLPLRYTADTTALVLHYDYKRRPEYTDTIYIVHNNIPFFESIECGYTVQQTVLKASFSTYQLDSIYIANKEAQAYETENFKLFFQFNRN